MFHRAQMLTFCQVSKDATIEQRVIAQEVFISLNRAWDIFRTQNNL
jgi:hypothetical protein